MKQKIKKLIFILLGYSKYNQVLSLKEVFQYFFFQKFLRINSNIPFPVHWTTYFGDIKNFKYPEDEIIKIGLVGCCYIQTIGEVEIGKNVIMGMGSKIISANHDFNNLSKHINQKVIIGNNVWIGSNVVILPGVKIGNNVIIGAGSIVTKIFEEDNIVIAGNPAKILKTLNNEN